MTYEKDLENKIEQLQTALEAAHKKINSGEKIFKQIYDCLRVDIRDTDLITINFDSEISDNKNYIKCRIHAIFEYEKNIKELS